MKGILSGDHQTARLLCRRPFDVFPHPCPRDIYYSPGNPSLLRIPLAVIERLFAAALRLFRKSRLCTPTVWSYGLTGPKPQSFDWRKNLKVGPKVAKLWSHIPSFLTEQEKRGPWTRFDLNGDVLIFKGSASRIVDYGEMAFLRLYSGDEIFGVIVCDVETGSWQIKYD